MFLSPRKKKVKVNKVKVKSFLLKHNLVIVSWVTRTFRKGYNINPAGMGSSDDDELDPTLTDLEISVFGQCFATEGTLGRLRVSMNPPRA